MSDLPVLSTFVPSEAHEVALRVYMETEGSASRASAESGLSIPTIMQVMRSKWWRDQIQAANFSPMTAKQIGDALQREVGHHALHIVGTRLDGLEIDDLVKLAKIGRDIQGAEVSAGVPGRITVLTQIDFRGMDRATLLALRGMEDCDDMLEEDYLDAEFEDV
jgi:hypothetical protein